jgi:hypothetical protein
MLVLRIFTGLIIFFIGFGGVYWRLVTYEPRDNSPVIGQKRSISVDILKIVRPICFVTMACSGFTIVMPQL